MESWLVAVISLEKIEKKVVSGNNGGEAVAGAVKKKKDTKKHIRDT